MERIADHLRGFDMAMVETGYRFGELWWAAEDRNWGYAEYQLEKMETALARGLERRPARAASARMFDGAVETVRSALQDEDGAALDEAMGTMVTVCNACHVAEDVAYILVEPPSLRTSVVRWPGLGESDEKPQDVERDEHDANERTADEPPEAGDGPLRR